MNRGRFSDFGMFFSVRDFGRTEKLKGGCFWFVVGRGMLLKILFFWNFFNFSIFDEIGFNIWKTLNWEWCWKKLKIVVINIMFLKGWMNLKRIIRMWFFDGTKTNTIVILTYMWNFFGNDVIEIFFLFEKMVWLNYWTDYIFN